MPTAAASGSGEPLEPSNYCGKETLPRSGLLEHGARGERRTASLFGSRRASRADAPSAPALDLAPSQRRVANPAYCYYNVCMPSWDESKRQQNIKDHGLDFEGADAIWDNFTITRQDIREDYGEQRLVTFGILDGELVVLVHTERDDDMHIISLRQAEKHEARYYFEVAEDYFRKGS